MYRLHLVLLAALHRDAFSANLATLRATSRVGATKHYRAVFAEWSSPDVDVSASPLVHSSADPYACRKQKYCRGCALLALQGRCTFALKAKNAQSAGMKLLVVASAKEGALATMSVAARTNILTHRYPQITALMVSNSTGRALLLANALGPLTLSCTQCEQAYSDLLSEALLGISAVGLVILGAWHSVEDLRKPHLANQKANEEVFAVEQDSGPKFVLVGSVMLTVLFFFMNYLIYLLILVFATGAISATASLLEPVIASRRPHLRERRAYRLPRWFSEIVGSPEEHTFADAIAEIFGVLLAGVFLIHRNNDAFGWIWQDLIAVALLLSVQRTARIPNLKVGTWLLVCTFFFDIFWVFLSPIIFKTSVMIEVATGGGTGQSVPMVLKIPALTQDLQGQFKILGLGDVAIPGLFISLLLRHDYTMAQQKKDSRSSCNGYFVPAVVGYAIGLCATFVSLYVMKHGQPALLFLVPGTLLPTFAIAFMKREFTEFWSADYSPVQPPAGDPFLCDGDKQA